MTTIDQRGQQAKEDTGDVFPALHRILGDLEESIQRLMVFLELHAPGDMIVFILFHTLALVLALSLALITRYRLACAREGLDENNRLTAEALALRPVDHPDRAKSLQNLAVSLSTRFSLMGAREDLDESIRLNTEALALFPVDHPARLTSLGNLAVNLNSRYDLAGAREDLDESIRLNAEALILFPMDHPDRVTSLSNLAVFLKARYNITNAQEDLEKSIQLDAEVLALRPEGHIDRAKSLNNLAVGLRARYNLAGARGDLDESIRLDAEALVLFPVGHPGRATSLKNLANGLSTRYNLVRAREDLDESIRLDTEALALCPPGHPDRARSLNNFAVDLRTRYNLTGSQEDLDKSIRLDGEALTLRPVGHPDRARSLSNLAVNLRTRYTLVGAQEDLFESIRLNTEALLLISVGHSDRAHYLNNLATGLGALYNLTGAREDLDKCIQLNVAALALRTVGHPDRGKFLNELAINLRTRYELTGAREDFDESIKLDAEALALGPVDHPDRTKSLNSLASSLRTRYTLAGTCEDLNESIQLDAEALVLRPVGHPDRAISLSSLAAGLSTRFSLAGTREDLEESIQLIEGALVLSPVGHPDRTSYLDQLATDLSCRFAITGAREDLDQSTCLHAEVLALHPVDLVRSLHHLAINLAGRYVLTGACEDLEECIRLETEALELCPRGHARHAVLSCALASIFWEARGTTPRTDDVFRLLKQGCTDIASPLKDSLRCMRLWIEWASEMHHDSLTDAYDHVVPFLRRYLAIGPSVTHQFDALKDAVDLLSCPMDAAARAIEDGDVEKAVKMLDEGRSLLWSEMRRFREPLLEPSLVGDFKELAAKFESTCSELQRLSTIESRYDMMSIAGRLKKADAGGTGRRTVSTSSISYNDLVPRKRKLLEEYERLLEQVRKMTGFEHFLQSPPFEKLQEAAKQGPVVIVNCSKLSSHVVIVFATESSTVIHLEDDFRTKAIAMHESYHDALRASKSSKALQRKLRPILSRLWDLVVSKVAQQLDDSGISHGSRIWWCPTSVLTVFPFHAAGKGKDWFMDSYISSYTPTLKALIDARRSPSTTSSGLHPNPRFLVVAPLDTGLPAAGRELSVIRALGPFVDSLYSSSATRESVLERLPSCDWVHFICHGTLSQSETAFDAALILCGGDRLKLHDIIKAHLPDAKFAFLAACHSAEQGRDDSVLTDEILHLASAMQFSGFRSVVGTLWEMNDEDGPTIAQHFYEKMLEGNIDPGQRHTQAARALWEVTQEMRRDKISLDRWANFVHIGA